MTMWHNVSALVKADAKTNVQNRDHLAAAIRANAEEIVKRVMQNTEPVGGAIRVRILLERADS